MASIATGTLTFLFTDIEGSTGLLRQAGDRYGDLLDRHRAIIRAAIADHSGTERGTEGDSFFVTFPNPSAAIAAAVAAQLNLIAEPWPSGLVVKVRMGIHLGEATDDGNDPVGLAIHHAARISATGHGGQIVISDAARISATSLPAGADIMALGLFRVRDVGETQLYQLVAPGLPVEFPPLRASEEVPGNLPVELSTFIGRTAELKALVEELDEHRLVTLIGVGGTGKTRLAVETAHTISSAFPDGCWMAELAAVMVVEAVPFAICAGLGITAPPEGDVITHLVSRLRDKRVLVVIDNCEHVLAAAADAVERIVNGCPKVVVLVTSREPLMIRGERMVPVPSLSPQEAERLFVERACDEAPDLVIDDEQARAVAELCQRLDGLPLALELAASRVRAFSPVELVTNLEERFRMLVGGRRSRMERHQTMRGTLDWSYDLCSEVEKAVFDRLSVFPAGFDLAGARAVASGDAVTEFDVVDVVPQLLDRSLLQRSTALDGTTRYRMLETMRAYGREHLHHQSVADIVRARHARHIATAIGALSLKALGPDEQQVLRRVNEYLPDSLVALDWCIDHEEWELGLQVTSADDELAVRERLGMNHRLNEGAHRAHTTGAPIDQYVMDELALGDETFALGRTAEQQAELGWRLIRSHRQIPTDRATFPPHAAFNDGGLEVADVDEFVASLERWLTAPPTTRFVAEWFTIRSLTHNGFVDEVGPILNRFTTFAESLHSARASRFANELQGTMARMRHDWAGATHWYGKVVAAGDGRLHSWLDLASSWYLLIARCLHAGPVRITGGELRDPWVCFRQEAITMLQWRGAVASALALHRLGHDDLADRFVAWSYANDPTGVMKISQFGDLLELAGIPTSHVECTDDLDTLVDELMVIADALDSNSA